MIKYFISSLIFFFIFMYFPATNHKFLPNVIESWIWNKSGGYGTRPYLDAENPTKILNGYKMKDRFFSFVSKEFYSVSSDILIEYPILGQGFYEYKKLGDEVSYYNGYKELYWKKPYSSYPRPGYYAGVIPLISGDGNTVFIADQNGNLSGPGEVNGRFVVDVAYSYQNERTLVLFAGGEYFLFDKSGAIINQYIPEKIKYSQTYFAKSASVSADGKLFAIHYQMGDFDYIDVHQESGKVILNHKLPMIIPHKLYFQLSNLSYLFIGLEDSYLLLDDDGDEIINFSSNSLNKIYKPIFILNELFIYHSENKVRIVNADGNLIREISLESSLSPIRFLPGKSEDVFYIETSNDIRQIAIR
ncbi:hypothetical protein [Leptospira sp. GIMC2001]|uniref:hypothetical protein n=1 Tax=Leptospira sp. GIMC2001 TaxID=1513297 RepID=UPI00234942C0|nr:hypothetical protein [Leptospira sp. GIMC2001]WCL48303.1 hypothetical protein O4O04_13425 [Leptospira sp. GIMC2001]